MSFGFWWCSCPWLPEPSVLRLSSVWFTWALLLWLGHDCCGYAASCQVGLAPGLACRKAQWQLLAAKASPLGLKLFWKGPRAACLMVQGRSYFGNHWCWLRWPARKDGAQLNYSHYIWSVSLLLIGLYPIAKFLIFWVYKKKHLWEDQRENREKICLSLL